MLRCNSCWNELDGKSVVTACNHIFCLKCAQAIVENNTGCTICEAVINKSTVKVVQSLADASAVKMMLYGSKPDIALGSALDAVNFYIGQKEMQADYKETQLRKKVTKLQESCLRKVEEVHKAYTQTKRKYDEAMRTNEQLQRAKEQLQRAHEQSQQDKQELQAKYSQKAMQARKLQEMVIKQQQEIEILRQNDQLRQGRAHGDSLGRGMENGRSTSPRPGEVVTAVQRTQVFADLASPANLGFGSGNRQTTLPSTGRVQGITGGYRAQHRAHSGGSCDEGGILGGSHSGSPLAATNLGLNRKTSFGAIIGAGMRHDGGLPASGQDQDQASLRKMLGMHSAQDAIQGAGRTAMRVQDMFTV